jgi:hypothetical protein
VHRGLEHYWNVTDRGKLSNVLIKTPTDYHLKISEPAWTVLALDKCHRVDRPVINRVETCNNFTSWLVQLSEFVEFKKELKHGMVLRPEEKEGGLITKMRKKCKIFRKCVIKLM